MTITKRNLYFLTLVSLAVLSFFSTTKNLYAQKFVIVAVVNDESISNFELFDRINLTIKSAGLKESPQIVKDLIPRTIQTLIVEKLQQQKAKELSLSITENDLAAAIKSIEQKNKLQEGGFDNFIKSQGIIKSSLISQMKSQLAWKKIVRKKIQPFITITDFEISEVTEQLKRKNKSGEVFLYEILLTSEKQAETLKFSEKLIKEIENGASFSDVAKEFSESSTAENGGFIGWIPIDNLSDELKAEITNTKDHGITKPIQTKDGVRIFRVGNRRKAGDAIDESKIRNFILMQKIDLESRKFLNKMRKDSFIEVKI